MRFRTKEEVRQHLLSHRTSGLSIAAYCKRENIHQNTFYRWRQKQGGQKTAPKISVVPPHPQLQFLHLPTQPPETQKIDITLPNGARLQVPHSCDITMLRQTIRMLASLRPR